MVAFRDAYPGDIMNEMAHHRRPHNRDASDVAARVQDVAGSLAVVWMQPYDRAASRVSPAQLRVLLVLDQHGPQNLTTLADLLAAIPSSATRLCDRLVAAGLVIREVDRADRRVVTLSLTRDGKWLLDDLVEQRLAALAEVLARMTSADQRALLRGLQAFATATARQDDD
jgi:DNA-binding MarR family transcriptional regulator